MPLKVFQSAIKKRIRLIMRKDKIYEGILEDYDVHINVYLTDATEISDRSTIINGGSIALIDICD
ncbi:hypothetical protein CWI38_0365p0020 [Hamiltosporidium tvaerminnensis]|uniref:Sm domain-containing protein n=1 Tax=Hamiltosporidium tvaerminnensis TaxID=1176355 RepID=A0A4Q9LAT6_9MICR|nr:hypothetical protein CWI37_0180p0040 [Hamiltosporidium tvaerminnensis]TBU13674.1 hypothetical protein CWI38_0365p0020 [Hamiltosporidium tvaerminnensis]